MYENKEAVQLLNTAVIKSKEKLIDSDFEKRLSQTCKKPAIEALAMAVTHLSDTQKISRDQAAIQIIEAVRELDGSWNDYLMMEGINKVKEGLKKSHH